MKPSLVLAALAAMSTRAEVNMSNDCHMWNEMGATWTAAIPGTSAIPGIGSRVATQDWY